MKTRWLKSSLLVIATVLLAMLISIAGIKLYLMILHAESYSSIMMRSGELELLDIDLETYKQPIRATLAGKSYLGWRSFESLSDVYGYHLNDGATDEDLTKYLGTLVAQYDWLDNRIILFPNFKIISSEDALEVLLHEILHALIGENLAGFRTNSTDGDGVMEGVVDYYAAVIGLEMGYEPSNVCGYPVGRFVAACLVEMCGEDAVLKATCKGKLIEFLDETVGMGQGEAVDQALRILARGDYEGLRASECFEVISDFCGAAMARYPDLTVDRNFAYWLL